MKRSFLQTRKAHLDTRPLVVGVVTGSTALPPQLKQARSPFVDVIEIRLDTFLTGKRSMQHLRSFSTQLIKKVKAETRKPILFTMRAADENGSAKKGPSITELRRSDLYVSVLPLVEMIDIEIRHSPLVNLLTPLAHQNNVDVIHSVHDFVGRRPLSFFQKLSQESIRRGGDVFKVATMPKSAPQLEEFLRWGGSLKNPHRVLIAMGALGQISRLIGYSFGSILTYGYLGRVAAPGQLSAIELGRKLRSIYS